MLIWLILLIGVAVCALAFAAYVVLAGRERREILGRVADGPSAASSIVLGPGTREPGSFVKAISSIAPDSWREDEQLHSRLVQAGWESSTAPLTYNTVRLVSMVAFPLAVAPFLAGQDTTIVLLLGLWALGAGYAIPVWYLRRAVTRRQEAIRRSIPDALDLLVVCVEAGVSLDSAILRVSRDLRTTHPEISKELAVVTRKGNAGMPRAQALRGLVDRTGVEEVRALVSTMIQSEKWGTSVGNVLSVYAETLRRKRRQAVEKKAATIPLKMLFPLVLLILPALFIIVLGPAAMQITQMMSGTVQR